MADVAKDRAVALGVGALSLVICGYCFWQAIALTVSVSSDFYGSLERDLSWFFTIILTVWLWGPPVIRAMTNNPSKIVVGKSTSKWRVFWQTQAAMYAISLGLFILCLGVCTGR